MAGCALRGMLVVFVLSHSAVAVTHNMYLMTPCLKTVGREIGISKSTAGHPSLAYALTAGLNGLFTA